ncbi:MAG: hypothetical protein WCG26_00225 [Chloroflexales bacterium]
MILYYSCSNKPAPFLERVFQRLLRQARETGQQLVAITGHELAAAPSQLVLHPRPDAKPWEDLFTRIMAGIELAKPPSREVVYLAEDDIIYPDEHWQQPCNFPGYLCHNFNVLYCSREGFFERYANCLVLSQYWGHAADIYQVAQKKLAEAKALACGCVEPCGVGYPNVLRMDHAVPSVDIRHTGGFNHSWDAANAAGDPEVTFLPHHHEIGAHAEFWQEWSPDRQ